MGSLFVVRHGQASFGQADYDVLSAVGQQQSLAVGAMLATRGLAFDRVLQGSMQRHLETARLCLQQMPGAPPAETCAWLNEFDHQAVIRALHPDFTDPKKIPLFLQNAPEPGKAFHKEFEKAMQRWMDSKHDREYPESYGQFTQRCHAGIHGLLQTVNPAANILIFTSGGPIASFMQLALGLSDAMVARLQGAIVNASLSRFPFKGEQLFLSYFNNYSHFDAAPSALLTYR